MQQGRSFLLIGGVLMILLGLMRGAGGLALLLEGPAVDPNIQATGSAVSIVGAILLLLAVVLVVAAAGVFRWNRAFWLVGIIATVAMVIDVAINGYVLYGQVIVPRIVINAVMAVLILGSLFLGKGSLRGGPVSP